MQSIERTFLILGLIAEQAEGMRLSDIAENAAMSKSTVSRFLSALEAEGAVHRGEDSRYRLGTRLFELAGTMPRHDQLIKISRPFLNALNQQTGESVALSVLDGEQVTYLLHFESLSAVQVADWTGRSVPLHVSSSGKLFMAQWPWETLQAYLQQPLIEMTSKSITSDADLLAALEEIRHRGYALSDEEFALEVIGIAVPIVRDGETVAGITLYGPKYRITDLDQLFARLSQSKLHIEIGLSA